MPFTKVEPLTFKRYGYVTPTLCDQLRRLSEQRCSQTEKFQQVRRDIARYLERKARKAITLNEEKFLKQRAELDAEKEEAKKIEEIDNNTRTGIERDYYLEEVLRITVDYLNLRQVAKAG